jgi:hypothetical protein
MICLQVGGTTVFDSSELLDADDSLSSGLGRNTSHITAADSVNAADPPVSASQQDAANSEYYIGSSLLYTMLYTIAVPYLR